jgi:hypothetical protein
MPTFRSGEEADLSVKQEVFQGTLQDWTPSFSFSYDDGALSVSASAFPAALPAYTTLMPMIPLDCPSLTSEATGPSIDEFMPPPNLARSLTALVGDMNKEDTNTNGVFTWNYYGPWECQRCGVKLQDASHVFCAHCTDLNAHSQ